MKSSTHGLASSGPLKAAAQALTQIQGADSLHPVTILVPNDIAGITLRRHLARGVGDRPGVAGIDVITLSRLAERNALGQMGARRPATNAVLTIAWRRALADDPGVFAEIAEHPTIAQALVRAPRAARPQQRGPRRRGGGHQRR